MTDWWTPGHNALWIVGLALGLAVLGVAHDEAQAEPDWLPVVARSEPGVVLPGTVVRWPGLVGARGLGAADHTHQVKRLRSHLKGLRPGIYRCGCLPEVWPFSERGGKISKTRLRRGQKKIFHCGGCASAMKNNLRHAQLDFPEPFGACDRIAPTPLPAAASRRGEGEELGF